MAYFQSERNSPAATARLSRRTDGSHITNRRGHIGTDAYHLRVRKKSMTERTVGRESRWICKTVESHDRTRRRGDVNRLEGTSLATGRRGDVNRLQRTHALGLAGARQRPELNRPQRAFTVHCHHSPSLQGRTPSLSLFRNVNARFLTRFNFSRPTGAT